MDRNEIDNPLDLAAVRASTPYSARMRFTMMIAGAIVIASLLVGLALELYAWSGASQLDLSLPTYTSVREQIKDDSSVSFSASGPIDKSTLDNFLQLFDKQMQQTNGSSGFSSQALSDESLGINMPQQ